MQCLLFRRKNKALPHSLSWLWAIQVANQEYRLAGRGRASPAQEPTKAGSGALRRVVVVVARVQLKHRVDPLVLIERLDLLRILPDIPQDRVPGLALLVSQGEVDAVWLALGLVGKDVLLHAGKPERAGHAAHPGKQIRPVDGVQGEQPGQRIPSDFPPGRNSSYFLLCRGDDLLGQQPHIVVRAAGAGLRIFEGGGLSQGTMSWFQSRLLIATCVNGGQPVACAVSNIFCPSPEKVLRKIIGVSDSEFGKIDAVLLPIVKGCIWAHLLSISVITTC